MDPADTPPAAATTARDAGAAVPGPDVGELLVAGDAAAPDNTVAADSPEAARVRLFVGLSGHGLMHQRWQVPDEAGVAESGAVESLPVALGADPFPLSAPPPDVSAGSPEAFMVRVSVFCLWARAHAARMPGSQ